MAKTDFFFTKNEIYKRHCLHQPKWIYIQNYFWSHWKVCERMRLLSRFSQSNTDLLMQLFHLLFIHNFRQNLSYTFFGWDANNNNKKKMALMKYPMHKEKNLSVLIFNLTLALIFLLAPIYAFLNFVFQYKSLRKDKCTFQFDINIMQNP